LGYFCLTKCIFTRVGTYVQRGSKFCFVILVLDTLIRILHYCPISPFFQHIAPLHAPLSCSLAWQPCPADLPGWQPALPASLARQPCRKVCKLFYGRRKACMQYCILLLGRQYFPVLSWIGNCHFKTLLNCPTVWETIICALLPIS
jgi:hypothetical protein